MKNRFSLLFAIVIFIVAGCSGAPHTWGYAHAANPKATSAYIRGVMAAESGDDASAISYFNLALSYENSPKVREERDAAVKRYKSQHPKN